MPFATEFSEEEQQRHNPNNLSQRRALNHLSLFRHGLKPLKILCTAKRPLQNRLEVFFAE